MSKQSWKGSTLLNPEPPVLVSCGGLETPNLITIGWTGTSCTPPSMVSISVRPERFSHHLIQESGQFAINLPTEALVRAVDWCGVKSGREVDKFAACGLHAAPGSVLTDCPLLEESPVNLECRVTQGHAHRLQPRRVSCPRQKAGHLRLQCAEEKENTSISKKIHLTPSDGFFLYWFSSSVRHCTVRPW